MAIPYRRGLLSVSAIFIGYLLWLAIDKDSATSISAVWPLGFCFIIILMLPEKRLSGAMFTRTVEALKGKHHVD